MMSSPESYTIPPSVIKIVPLPPGEVVVSRNVAVFRGELDIRCSYSSPHRVVLPRRSTVSAVYKMYIPTGYELRRIPSSPPRRHVYSSLPHQSTSAASPSHRVHYIGSTSRAPRAVARRSRVGPPPGFEGVVRTRSSHCNRCRHIHGPTGPSAPVMRDVPMMESGPSHQVRRRTREDADDRLVPQIRPRLSPQVRVPGVGTHVVGVTVSEEDPEEDPDAEEEEE